MRQIDRQREMRTQHRSRLEQVRVLTSNQRASLGRLHARVRVKDRVRVRVRLGLRVRAMVRVRVRVRVRLVSARACKILSNIHLELPLTALVHPLLYRCCHVTGA